MALYKFDFLLSFACYLLFTAASFVRGRISQLELGIETSYMISFIIRISQTVEYYAPGLSVSYLFWCFTFIYRLSLTKVFYIILIMQPCRKVDPFIRYSVNSEGGASGGSDQRSGRRGSFEARPSLAITNSRICRGFLGDTFAPGPSIGIAAL